MLNILLSHGLLSNPKHYIYLKNYINNKNKVLIIPWAFGKDEDYKKYKIDGEYINRIKYDFMPYQVPFENIEVLDYYDDTYEDMINKIKKQDLIYLPGGFPDLFFARIREKGISDLIKQNAKIVIGSSAGAMIQFKQYHITPDKDYKTISFNEGLPLLDNFRIEVHYHNNKKKNKNIDQTILKAPVDIYTIPEEGMIIVEDDGKMHLLFGAKKYQTMQKKK